MPEGGERALVVVPGGAEVGTSAVGRVQTPSRLGGGGGGEHKRMGKHTRAHTHPHTQIYAFTHTDGTHKGNGTNVVRKMG